jgi:SusD/RagB-like outer membrane lipoprotein
MRTSTMPSRAMLCFVFIAGLAGCKDFLATEPKGVLTTEAFFKTPEQAIQATNATYGSLRLWQVHVFAWIGLTDIASDDATKGSIPGDADFLGKLDNLDFLPDNIAFIDPWTGYYWGIRRANVGIENIPNVPMDAALKARLIGENKFLRAYFYFFLVRAFGGVPLITKTLRPDEYRQQRATADQVYDLIEQDLVDAIAALPEKGQYPAADLGRATKGAAHGLLAQVNLYRKDYASALQYAEAVISSGEYQLYSDYGTIFSSAGENSSESLFEVQAAVTPGGGKQPDEGGANMQYSEVQGIRGPPNTGWGFNTPSDGLEAAYEPGDPRLQATVLFPWEMLPDGSSRVVYVDPGMPNNRYNEKAFISPDNPNGSFNSGVNIRRLRYADVLLIAAEAAYQTGDEAKAQTYLNQVRQRARGQETLTLGFTSELLNESIAVDVLGLPAGSSRVFARHVKPATPAHTAGLRSFTYRCVGGCAAATIPPVRVDTMDIIQSVDGSPVTTPTQFRDAVDTKTAGAPVALGVLRVMQDPGTGVVATQPLVLTITAEELLPDVAASGQALRDTIWHERRAELAMEQHRWFDIIRQNGVAPGRAVQLLGAAFIPRDTLYPIPAREVTVAGLQQNPGY